MSYLRAQISEKFAPAAPLTTAIAVNSQLTTRPGPKSCDNSTGGTPSGSVLPRKKRTLRSNVWSVVAVGRRRRVSTQHRWPTRAILSESSCAHTRCSNPCEHKVVARPGAVGTIESFQGATARTLVIAARRREARFNRLNAISVKS